VNLNLILAVFWLVLSVGLFLYPRLHPQGARLTIGQTGISFAWVAVFFFGYNLLRWWLLRLQKRDRERMDHVSDRHEERNPDFDFSDDAK
jgi:hypothetical protein